MLCVVFGSTIRGAFAIFLDLLLNFFLFEMMEWTGLFKNFIELFLIKFSEKQEVIQEGKLHNSGFQLIDKLDFFGLGQQSGSKVNPVKNLDFPQF